MRLALFAAAALLLPTAAAHADEPATPDERARILAVLAAEGCSDPRKIERETDDGRLKGYEVEDAKCADGVYDFDLDLNFAITDRDRDD
ncbi:MAG TPA: hypothetical protein PKB04_05035 [Phenylobacterium sp.]|nr:hypothetical protein [Phenylobacterium sp.]